MSQWDKNYKVLWEVVRKFQQEEPEYNWAWAADGILTNMSDDGIVGFPPTCYEEVVLMDYI